MSSLLGVRNEDDGTVWWSESSKYPGIEQEDDDLYKFELYKIYSENPQSVADKIVSWAEELQSI